VVQGGGEVAVRGSRGGVGGGGGGVNRPPGVVGRRRGRKWKRVVSKANFMWKAGNLLRGGRGASEPRKIAFMGSGRSAKKLRKSAKG